MGLHTRLTRRAAKERVTNPRHAAKKPVTGPSR